jgi:acetyltransferase
MRVIPEQYPDKVFLILSLVHGMMHEGAWRGEPPKEPVMRLDGVPFLQGAENGLRAVRNLNRYAEYLRARAALSAPAAADGAAAEQARAIVAAAGGRPLVEREAKHVLALYGIRSTRERLVTNAEDAVAAAEDIGYPVVLKIESPDIAHKTEAGGVLLNLSDADAVRAGFQQVVDSARAYNPAATIGGVLVQEMVTGGRELILGMTRDAEFGPAIAIGLGGIFVEILKDVQLGVPPLTEHDARAMIARLRGKAILEGARGAAPADVDAVVDTVRRFSRLCLDLQDDVAEIDINPLLVFDRGAGACVVDCLVIPRDAGRGMRDA